MLSVGIIGCGSIGQRHYQGVVSVFPGCTVYGFDPHVNGFERISFLNDVKAVVEKVDIVILADNTISRLENLVAILLSRRSACVPVVVEKPLFDNWSDFAELKSRVANFDNVFLHFPRHFNRQYVQCVRGAQKLDDLNVSVSLKTQSVLCNIAHYVDLVQLMAFGDILAISMDGTNEIVPAKRAGFFEVTGAIRCSFEHGELLISHDPLQGCEVRVILFSGGKQALEIVEAGKQIKMSSYAWEDDKTIPNYYVSESTGMLVEALVNGVEIPLPTLDDCFNLHLNLARLIRDEIDLRGLRFT